MGKTTEEIIAEVPAEEKQRFCQFWTGEPSRPCSATTQTSCRRCRFFTPFIGGKAADLDRCGEPGGQAGLLAGGPGHQAEKGGQLSKRSVGKSGHRGMAAHRRQICLFRMWPGISGFIDKDMQLPIAELLPGVREKAFAGRE